MALEWIFYLDSTEIDEPKGFSDIVFKVSRDETWHGIMIEASTSQLGFYGPAFDYLKAAKEQYGVDAIVIFTAQVTCDEGSTAYVTAITGKLNFAQYKETCGNECIISLSVEQGDCTMLLKNRFDQKVNVDNYISVGGVVLTQYNGLGFTMDLATQDIPISADASVETDGATLGSMNASSLQSILIRPTYAIVRDNSILTGELDTPASFYQDPDITFSLSPQVLLEENRVCVSGDYDYAIRLKGSVSVDIDSPHPPAGKLVFGYWNGVSGTLTGDMTIIASATFQASMADGVTYSFDQSWSGTATIPDGSGVYAFLQIERDSFPGPIGVNPTYSFDPETSFLLSATKSCPPTDCKVYLVNETLSRIAESITDRCLTVYSDYYGRTDSEPYSATEDGCGSLRVLTSGLRIRQANDKEFFLSLKEALEGLKAIDNIGMGVETDRLRIEPVEYFYQNVPLLTIDLVPKADKNITEEKIYSIIKVGYKKWEIKSIKGIDEFNSTKEFHTGIKSVSRTLDIESNLIASGYIIETLRSSTLAVSGNADSTYDNDTFIICVQRDGAAYYQYEVEQGIIDNPSEMFSPSTVYNWRIRPLYNLMRWAKSIFPSYAVIQNTASKIFFSSGTGNYLAEGNLNASDDCRLENKTLAENSDISINDFDDILTPVWAPENIEFDYYLSLRDYQTIKDNPYGYINVQCGQGDYFKYFIKSIEYKPSSGEATFNLTLKWL